MKDLKEKEIENILTNEEHIALMDSVPLGVAILKDRKIIKFNRKLVEFFSPEDSTINYFLKSTKEWYESEEEFVRVGKEVYPIIELGKIARIEAKFKRLNGSLFWGRLTGKAFNEKSPQEESVWILEDITQEKLYVEELNLSRKALEESSEAILITDKNNKILKVNKAFEKITGWTSVEVIGQDPKILKGTKKPKEFYEDMWKSLKEKKCWEGEVLDRRKDGTIYPKWLKINAITNDSGEIINYVGLFNDISHIKDNEEKLNYLASNDQLTKLPNRMAFEVHLAHAMARAKLMEKSFCVLFLDLDDFKIVNDTMGHSNGDRVLCESANRISGCLRDTDIAGRFGGDEFVVLLEEGNFPADAVNIANKIIDAITVPIDLNGRMVKVGTSIGITMFPECGDSIDEVVHSADGAMYIAKTTGKNQFCFSENSGVDAHTKLISLAKNALNAVLNENLHKISF